MQKENVATEKLKIFVHVKEDRQLIHFPFTFCAEEVDSIMWGVIMLNTLGCFFRPGNCVVDLESC